MPILLRSAIRSLALPAVRRTFCALASTTALLTLYAPAAAAQTWPERVLISINGAYQPTANDFSDHFTFDSNLETGTTDVTYPVKGGFVFDAGIGYRFWKNLGAGVAVSYFTHDDTAATSSQFPHPFFFNQPRAVTGDASGITRTETAVHAQLMYLWNPSGPLRVAFSGGPSFFKVEQDVVTAVKVTETFPFDTAAFASVDKKQEKKSAVAFNVGADVMWMLGTNVGVGGLVRFARASVDIPVPNNRTVSVDAGGVQVGGGLRLVF